MPVKERVTGAGLTVRVKDREVVVRVTGAGRIAGLKRYPPAGAEK
jgi:hypothetical protein